MTTYMKNKYPWNTVAQLSKSLTVDTVSVGRIVTLTIYAGWVGTTLGIGGSLRESVEGNLLEWQKRVG